MLNHDTPEQQSLTPDQIIADCVELMPQDTQYSQHSIIQRFGTPLKPICINPQTVQTTNSR